MSFTSSIFIHILFIHLFSYLLIHLLFISFFCSLFLLIFLVHFFLHFIYIYFISFFIFFNILFFSLSVYPSPHSRRDVLLSLSAPHEGDEEMIFPISLRPDYMRSSLCSGENHFPIVLQFCWKNIVSFNYQICFLLFL